VKCTELVEDVALMIFGRFLVPIGQRGEEWTLLLPPAPPPVEAPAAPPPPPPAPERPRPQPVAAIVPPPLLLAPEKLPFKREASLAFVVGFRDTPHVALGGAFQVGLQWPWFSIAFEMRGVFDHRGDIDGVPVRTSVGTIAGVPCLVLGDRVRLCTPFAGGWCEAVLDDGWGSPNGRQWQFVGTGGRVSYDHPVWRRLWIRAYGEVLFSIRGARWKAGPVISPDDDGELWTTPWVLPSVGVGVVWRF
jgi:hypothetical protein